jgi:hypothetical protein
MSQSQVILDQKTKKLLRMAKIAARLSRDKENYRKALSQLIKTIPKETRSAIARYAAALKVAIEDPSPENLKTLGELALQKKLLINSWKAETRKEREIVSQVAKRFYASLELVVKTATELEKEFAEELAGVEE